MTLAKIKTGLSVITWAIVRSIEKDKYLEAMTEQYYDDTNIHKSKTRVEIPTQKEGSKYSLKNHSKQQQAVVIASINTM